MRPRSSGTPLVGPPESLKPTRQLLPAWPRLAPFVAALSFVILAGGCRYAGLSVTVWVCEEPPHHSLRARDASDPADAGSVADRIELAGAINETVSFHFAVRSSGETLEHPDLRVVPLASGPAHIDPSAVNLYRMQRVTVGPWPGWHVRSIPPNERDPEPLDVLVPIRAPLGGLPSRLLAGETYHFWADVAIPKGTFSGTYVGRIELLQGGKRVGALAVQLTVWPFMLPDQVGPPVLAELDHRKLICHHIFHQGRPHTISTDDWRGDPRGDEVDALLMATLRMLQSHRLTPVLPRLSPPVKIGRMGEIAVDWSQYDAVVEPCLTGEAFFNRVGLPLWPLPVHQVFSAPPPEITAALPRHAELLRDYLRHCVRHFESKGWLDRSYALPPAVGASRIEEVQALRGFAANAHLVDSPVSVVSGMFPQDLAPLGWVDYPFVDFSECVDVWMLPAQFYEVEAMAAQRAVGKRTWLAVDRPPFSGSVSVFAPSSHARVLTWQARQLGATAMSVGCINAWPDVPSDPAAEDCIQADPNVLLYPGRAFGLVEPIPSVRLKWLRRSMGDAAYCALLERHGLAHVTSILRRSIAPYAGSGAYRTHFADGRPIGWVNDPSLYEDARAIMAEALIEATDPQAEKTRVERFTRNANWRRFMLEARKVHIHVDGTRVRFSGTRAMPAAEVECALTIVNGKRTPLSGIARFKELPEGWTVPNEGRTIGPTAHAA